MGGPPNSQVAPLPSNLPFRVISKTIGSGAYASIRKATPPNAPSPVIAIKFINKEHAFRAGRLRPKQLKLEISLHQNVCGHQNVIRLLTWGEDTHWMYMAMELADGGDLFDKIEADEGVVEDVAHLYFVQLTNAIGWCHSKGVAHRDIKPENMLLDGSGNLKLADFGLAVQFQKLSTGERKKCGMVCGSPPYIAPEIYEIGDQNAKRKQGEDKLGYDPEISDVWSCAIVLFVLLAGNTPWDAPKLTESYEYHDYVKSNSRPEDPLWNKIPMAALSLVRAMLKIDAKERISLYDVKKHPWFTRQNPSLAKTGMVENPLELATQMMEGLRIDFNADISASQRQRKQPTTTATNTPKDATNTDTSKLDPGWSNLASTQPETPIADLPLDWEIPPRLGAGSASQPTTTTTHDRIPPPTTSTAIHDAFLRSLLAEDPSMSQFSQMPVSQMTSTQQARRFKDIVPSHSLARFLSHLPLPQLLPLLTSALHRLNIPVPTPNPAEGEDVVSLRIKTLDSRRQPLQGNLVAEKVEIGGGGLGISGNGGGVPAVEVRFLKAKGDPLEWRRLFKQVAILCKDAIPRD
ncbi:kinase-like protein [Hortaea werneckii]|nr:kinase-like protein [Hortaea werneckii]